MPDGINVDSLISLSSQAHADSSMSLADRMATETSLAVDPAVIQRADVRDTVTALGEMSSEETALIERSIPLPETTIPQDNQVPIQYMEPPTRDELASRLGPRGYPWPEKLQNALNTVSSEASQRIGQIRRQQKWSKSAGKLVEELSLKKAKVNQHIATLTREVKGLLKKKKQIQNKKLQDKLVARLEVVHNNLRKVRRQTHYIRKNQADMIHHKEELAHALEGIKRSIAVLKGFKRKRKFPSRGAARKLKDKLSQFDPDLSHEEEADEVRRLQFPDMVFLQHHAADAGIDAEQ